jgi:predicted XRE-type DNA-binding protein
MRRTPANGTRMLRSSGNAFADVGIAGTDAKKTKAKLAVALNKVFRERNLTQQQTASLLRITQPKVSALT